MKYIAYFRSRETHFRNDKFTLRKIGIGEITSETNKSYGLISYELEGRGLEGKLESLATLHGWRRAYTIVDKDEELLILNKKRYETLLAEIRKRNL